MGYRTYGGCDFRWARTAEEFVTWHTSEVRNYCISQLDPSGIQLTYEKVNSGGLSIERLHQRGIRYECSTSAHANNYALALFHHQANSEHIICGRSTEYMPSLLLPPGVVLPMAFASLCSYDFILFPAEQLNTQVRGLLAELGDQKTPLVIWSRQSRDLHVMHDLADALLVAGKQQQEDLALWKNLLVHFQCVLQDHSLFRAELLSGPTCFQSVLGLFEWLCEHPGADVLFSQLAKESGCSRRAVERAYRACFAASPAAHRQNIRLTALQRGIESGSISYGDVLSYATACGLKHGGMMAQRFRGVFGSTPRQLIQRVRARKEAAL